MPSAGAEGGGATQPLAVGQRWLSETQSELGLGLVEDFDERLITLRFPAVDETRTYARRNAPLWRAVFGVGDRIRESGGPDLSVVAVDEHDGLVNYVAKTADNEELRLPEAALDAHLQLNRPAQKLLAGRLDKDAWVRLRRRTRERAGAWSASAVRGLAGARISPVAHQLYIAAEVAGRYAPRVLLADEVGLGKTIEAGLILHRMLLEGRARRVLILVPEPLLHQWLVELLRRFNLRFSLFDVERIAAGEIGRNPFESEQRVLCSLDLLTGVPVIGEAAAAAQWDLLIVDEAHHLHWSPQEPGADYALVEALARKTPAVLLLTATPEQLGRAGHFGRLRLLDQQRFGDYDAFLAEEADYAPVAEIAARLLAGEPPTTEQRARIDALLGETGDLSPAQLIERLLDRHGTGRLLFRNTRSAIAGFPERRLHPYPLACPEGYAAGADAEPSPEAAHGAGWTELDPRVPWLLETLRRLQPEKVLLITAHARTVVDLQQHLARRVGLHAAVFHEGMEIVERDRAAAYFADPREGTQLLLCSEIGSEGRNFQFAHHLVLFDLPTDPDLLEQRIGRLDRIGQTQPVEIHVPYLTGTAGEVLFRWYAEGLNALAANCPAGAALTERLGARLHSALSQPGQADALIAEAAELREVLNAQLQAGRDRLLELSSHREAVSAPLVDAVLEQDRDPTLFEYLGAYWDAFGVDHEPGPGGATVLHPGKHMLQERFPELPEDGLTVTFDRGHALAHEDRAFLSWEHPMVRAAMELLTGSDLGTASVLLTRDRRFPASTLLLELLLIVECPAPAELQVGRYLPSMSLRIVVDEQGRDLSSTVNTDELVGKCLTGNRKLAGAVIQAKRAEIERMIEAGEALAADAGASVRQETMARMETLLDAEIERLSALARVNPSIRPEEIDHLADNRRRLGGALSRMHLRLDALRLLVFA
ncbi:MAG: RNA polymerase-associated protein RapA [Thiohalocapsa sp.]|nr:RNA polymerase-associated protein RapA [Thiohalocapsa sp.]MCF7990883.1 RNA polymerase-associated protein RapA [Thiohalocapsa sp.]